MCDHRLQSELKIFRLEERKMKGNHPKRRRDKYNPYWIYEKGGHYYITFEDGQKMLHEFEISRYLYDVFDSFELDDLVYLNAWERHYERGEVWETTLNTRLFCETESLEEVIIRKNQIEELHKAMKKLSKIQQRRIELYYFEDMTYEQIAKEEKCSFQAVEKSIATAIKKLKEILK